MVLPEKLAQAIDEELQAIDARALAKAASELSRRYLQADFRSPALASPADRAAYLVVRLPATFAAIIHVLEEVLRRNGDSMTSMLDLAAGPGTAMWSALQVFPHLREFTAIERDQEMSAMGKRLAAHAGLNPAAWLAQDLESSKELSSHDLVVMSYGLGELRSAPQAIHRAWEATRQVLVFIEPGTPRGFHTILEARQRLLSAGAHMLAPCPHTEACPMDKGDNWCHFAERVQRTSLHRRLKQGTLGHEDEKFSYVAFSRAPLTLPERRILRHPLKHPGHVQLTLCAPGELEKPVIARSQEGLYRAARKAKWGDSWPPS